MTARILAIAVSRAVIDVIDRPYRSSFQFDHRSAVEYERFDMALLKEARVFRKILVPVDFTRKNLGAVDEACRLGGPESSQLILLHVIEEVAGVPFMEMRKFYKDLESRASKEMETLARRVQRRHRHVRTVIEIGRRADAIVRYAREHEIDLIVMSSHRMRGKTPHPSVWATISHVVAALAPCSTLLVK